MTFVTPIPLDLSEGRLPTAPVCPVTGGAIDISLGLWPIHFHDEAGLRHCLLVGGADQEALVDIHRDPQTYGLIAWSDYLEQRYAEDPTPLPISY